MQYIRLTTGRHSRQTSRPTWLQHVPSAAVGAARRPNLGHGQQLSRQAASVQWNPIRGIGKQLLRVGGISCTGLAPILEKLRKSEVPRFSSRAVLYELNKEYFKELRCSVQVPAADGGELTWIFVDPSKLIATMIAKNRNLQNLFVTAVRRTPPSQRQPWRLAVGFDEFVPGFALAGLCCNSGLADTPPVTATSPEVVASNTHALVGHHVEEISSQ